jgi:sterol desaturase/sphingolipid hydroxylase (fatty acid hydroxylase superfamily)
LLYYTTGILIIWMVFIILLERYFPYRPGLSLFREGFWVDLVWYTLIQSYFLKILIFDDIIFPFGRTFPSFSGHFVSKWPVWTQVLFFLVTHDFYIYWFHRWQHSNKLLWRTHEAHHSNKEVDWLAGSRSHSIEILINQTVEFAPIVLLGASPMVIPVKALLDAAFGMYIHANINLKAGYLKYIVNGPELHLWHHANDRRVFHANFATKFSFWDWLFGTAFHPEEKPCEYGLYYAYPKDYFVQHIFSVKRIDEQKLLNKKNFRLYAESRQRLMKWISGRIDQVRNYSFEKKMQDNSTSRN